jgi:mRNA interferase HigB
MHVISRKRLNEFAERHPDAKASLAYWYQLIKRADFASVAELRTVFPLCRSRGQADSVQCWREQGSSNRSDPL